ncbi:MAG: hypothetical protein JNL21_02275 [Myxococcales bacterium]|nr:hypothetical protein [Myxococcales bacterium]
MRSSRPLLAFVALGLAACQDPLVGRWEADNEKVFLVIEAGDTAQYEGEGRVYLCPVDSRDGCRLCSFTFEIEAKGGDTYAFDGEFVGKCDDFGEFEDFECDLVEGDLECELPGGVEAEYERQEETSE